jgi:hypothetical protein
LWAFYRRRQVTIRFGREAMILQRRLSMILALTFASTSAVSQLPPGGTSSWKLGAPEEIVTFLLFDPQSPGVSVPAGLRFVPAKDAPMPEIQEYVKAHPEHAGWAFSVFEITRQKEFLIDGKAPTMPEQGGIGLWIAPVDTSGLAEEIPKDAFDRIVSPALGAVLVLGLWVPDRAHVAYMRERGHHAEYGEVRLRGDGTAGFRGEIRLDDLHVRASVTPRGEGRQDPESGTQVLFVPGTRVEHAFVLSGSGGTHRACDGDWSKEGNHLLTRGVFVGPTYLTSYDEPLTGSSYPLRKPIEP